MRKTDFDEYCYREYKDELAASDRLVSRFGFLLTSIGALSTLLVAVANAEWLQGPPSSVVHTVYALSAVAAFVLLVASAACLSLAIWPKRYSKVQVPGEYAKWRADYERELEQKKYSEDQREEAVANQTRKEIFAQMNGCTDRNRASNDRRERLIVHTVRCLVLAMTSLFVMVLYRSVIIFAQ